MCPPRKSRPAFTPRRARRSAARKHCAVPSRRRTANAYRVWQKPDSVGGPAGKYLVDDSGAAVWLVDPGINGAFKTRPDGTQVQKFDAPKATLMSYIIKGMLDRKLPWGLVLFGVMIAVVLELCGVSSLAFAVGVYLPIASSAPIFVGGLVRWVVDYRMRRALREHKLDEAALAAESDKSPGVLLASGYIAGGAIAGIVIAFVQGVTTRPRCEDQHVGQRPQPVLRRAQCRLAGADPLRRAGRFPVSDTGTCKCDLTESSGSPRRWPGWPPARPVGGSVPVGDCRSSTAISKSASSRSK